MGSIRASATVSVERAAGIDPFTDPAERDRIDAECQRLAGVANAYYGVGPAELSRQRKSEVDLENPATAELMAQYPCFGAWLQLVPTASALDVLYAPKSATLPNGTEVDEASRRWFENVADAVGIRSRAAVLSRFLAEEANRPGAKDRRWLSLACGAAQPVLSVLGGIRAEGGEVPQLALMDLDSSAMALARSYAENWGISDRIVTRRANVLRIASLVDEGLSTASPRLTAGSMDVVEAVGLLEYLGAQDWGYEYQGVVSSKRKLAGAVSFLRNAYELVAPGGALIVGNMLDSHPQLDFTLNVIQWPHIQPRSVDAMAGIFAEAGITEPIDAVIPEDGVYAMYRIRKP